MNRATSTSVGVVGSVNIDFVVRVQSLPQPGETVLGDNLVTFCGGKGANQAAASARIGAATTLVGTVGDDANGAWLLEQLEQQGVQLDVRRDHLQPTGTAFIVVDDTGENSIVVAPGANGQIDMADVDLSRFDVILAQQEIPESAVLAAARSATTFILNAAPARPLSDELLALCDVVIVNETEAHSLDRSRVRRLVVTRGSRGAQYFIDGEEVAQATPPLVTPVDTVGAGDTFCAAFAIMFANGAAPQEALAYAVTAGALATLAQGAQGSLPTDEEIHQWLARVS